MTSPQKWGTLVNSIRKMGLDAATIILDMSDNSRLWPGPRYSRSAGRSTKRRRLPRRRQTW